MEKKFKDPKGKEIFYDNGEWFEKLYPELTQKERKLMFEPIFGGRELSENEQKQLQKIRDKQKKKATKKDVKKANDILNEYLPKDAKVLHFNIHFRGDKDYGKLVWKTGEGQNVEQGHKSIQRFHY